MNTTTLPKSLSVKSKVIINKSSHIFNKLVYYVGLFVISIIVISLSQFILENYSMQLEVVLRYSRRGNDTSVQDPNRGAMPEEAGYHPS